MGVSGVSLRAGARDKVKGLAGGNEGWGDRINGVVEGEGRECERE